MLPYKADEGKRLKNNLLHYVRVQNYLLQNRAFSGVLILITEFKRTN
jgi:hypothetical protein